MRNDAFQDFLYVAGDVGLERPAFPGEAFSISFLTGASIYRGRVRFGTDEHRDLMLNTTEMLEFLSSQGQYACIIHSQSGHDVISSDPFGYHPIFYFMGRGEEEPRLVVSNRFNLLVAALRDRGVPLSLNLPHVAAQVLSTHVFYMQPHSHETAADRIFLLPVDAYLHVGSTVEIRKKPSHLDCGGETYDAALESGVNEVVSSLCALGVSESVPSVVTSITGGRDSRAVFSACLTAGLRTRMTCYTDGSTTNPSPDLRIAVKVTETFGGKWHTGDGRAQYAVELDEAFATWRYHLSNFYNRMHFGTHVTRGECEVLHLTGAAGEIYRTFWSQMYRGQAFDHSDSLEVAALGFFDRVTSVELRDDLREAAFRSFLSALKDMPGDSILDKLESHYFYFRSRAHFGTDYTNRTVAYTWHPLSSLHLVRAARVLAFNERAQGRVLFDFMDKLLPLMNYIEFAGGPFGDEIVKRATSHKIFGGFNIPNPDLEGWRRADIERRSALLKRQEATKFSWSDFGTGLQLELDRVLARLRGHAPALSQAIGTTQLTSALQNIGPNDLHRGLVTLAKIYNALDVFEPVSPLEAGRSRAMAYETAT